MSDSSVPTIGIVGIGNWGKNHLRNYATLPTCKLGAVCDRDPKLLEKAHKDHPGVFVTEDFEAMLNRPELDAIVIASSAVTHAPLGLQALRSGRDVFLEKPMALSAADAEELQKSAESGKRVLMIGHLLLYHPAVDLLKKLIVEGELGEPHYIYSQRVNLGQIRKDENALWSFAPHDLSVVGELFPEKPVSVSARGGAYIQPDVEDVVFVSVKYPGDRMANIHVSWLDPHKIRKFTLVGSKKMAVFDDMEPIEKVRVFDKGITKPGFLSYDQSLKLHSGDVVAPEITMTEPLKIECQHFIECVQDRSEPRTGAESGVTVVRILEGAQKSLEQDGRPIAI